MFDFNKVRLIGITKPVIESCEVPEDLVAYAARVSNPTNQVNNLSPENLLKYLVLHKHWSPLEMVNIVIEIETPRDIARQILRHRSFSFQEFSQRYADPTKSLGMTTREARLQDTKNRQNSLPTSDEELKNIWNDQQNNLFALSEKVYKWAIENGIAKEQARAVLPEGLTLSRMYVNGTLRSWVHYCQLRRSNGTQLEHMDVANKAWAIIAKEFPSISKALE